MGSRGWFYDGIQDKVSELEKYSFPSRGCNKVTYRYDFLKEKELYEKTMDEIYAKRYI